MDLTIVDTAAIYRRLLQTPDGAERESIYREQLLAPFAGMFRVFGGGDPLALAKGWGLYGPEEMANGARAAIASILDRLDGHDAWTRTAEALERGRAAFAPIGIKVRMKQESPCGMLRV